MKGFANAQYATAGNTAHVKWVLRLLLNMLQHVLGNSLQCGNVSLLTTCLAQKLNWRFAYLFCVPCKKFETLIYVYIEPIDLLLSGEQTGFDAKRQL